MMKRCRKCNWAFSLNCFYHDRANKDGHKNICKVCSDKTSRKWRINHPQQRLFTCKQWDRNNKGRRSREKIRDIERSLMFQSYVKVNNQVFNFSNFKEAITYTMNLAVIHHKYAPFEVLKENAYIACDLTIEFINLIATHTEDTKEKGSLKRFTTKILRSKDFISKIHDKNIFLSSWNTLMLSIEGIGLLPNFGFTNKHGDKLKGNSEKISVTKVIY